MVLILSFGCKEIQLFATLEPLYHLLMALGILFSDSMEFAGKRVLFSGSK